MSIITAEKAKVLVDIIHRHDHPHGAAIAEAVKDRSVADTADGVCDGDHSDDGGDSIAGQSSADFLRDAARLSDQDQAGAGQKGYPDVIQPEGTCTEHL